MKIFTQLLLVAIIFSACNSVSVDQDKQSSASADSGMKSVGMSKLSPKVTGIGGIFFKTEDPKLIREWYGENLGMAIDEYGSPFEFRNANRPDEINYLRWSPHEHWTTYFDPSKKDFMINYRVQNIEALVENLRKNNVTIVKDIQEYDFGKFAHVMDPEGNKIELWEPVDNHFTKKGGETTK